jgi:CMP-N,N'-diacetyllegionaminic acid synthase
MANACFIPARAGSKGLPHKNRRLVGGESLLARCVRTCRQVTDHVYVCTDDPVLEDEMRSLEVNCVPRPAILSADDSKEVDVLRYMMYCIDKEWDKIASVHCTSPLTTANDIRRGFDALVDNVDVVMPVVSYSGIAFDKDGPINYNWREPLNRQERKPQYEHSGGGFFFRPEHLKTELYDGKIELVLTDHPSRCDIDSEEDLEYANMVIRRQQSGTAGTIYSSDTVC